MAPQPPSRHPDHHTGHRIIRHPLRPKSSHSPPPATQEAKSVSQANVATLDMSAPKEQLVVLPVRENQKPRHTELPLRMSQTSGISKKRQDKSPSTPALAQRIEHSLAAVARSGGTSNAATSEARPSFSREAAPSVEAPPKKPVASRNSRGRNPQWRAGDASDAAISEANPDFALVLPARFAAPRGKTRKRRNRW
jgi:hypothetical protein